MRISLTTWNRGLVPGLVLAAGVTAGVAGGHFSRAQSLPGQLPSAAQSSDPLHQKNRDEPTTPSDILAKQSRARNDERQRKLMADTDKLLALATSLHDDVAKTNKDVMSLDVIKRADEIEKLAHNVKERMKG